MPLAASAQGGGFGSVIFFVCKSNPSEKFALKKAKVTNTDTKRNDSSTNSSNDCCVMSEYVCMYVWSSHIAEYGSTG